MGEEPGAGSSPLARGLHISPSCEVRRRGIIPARAGFTRRECRSRRRGGDHPRSRGVYPTVTARVESIPGSSPLARGLRSRTPRSDQQERIIPARAGFTRMAVNADNVLGDHPRSRGVYEFNPVSRQTNFGSSPLARGLRGCHEQPRGPKGIIPARAGFTSKRTAPWWTSSDHPRSRGVYPTAALKRLQQAGSSPLARGLRLPAL